MPLPKYFFFVYFLSISILWGYPKSGEPPLPENTGQEGLVKKNTNSEQPRTSEDALSKDWLQAIHSYQAPKKNNTGKLVDQQTNEKGGEGGLPQANSQVNSQTEANSTLNKAPSLIHVIIKFMIFIFLLIFFIYIGGSYFKKVFGFNRSLSSSHVDNEIIQVLAKIPLDAGGGKFLQVVDVSGLLLILGLSDSNVQLLEKIEDANVANRIRIWHAQKMEERQGQKANIETLGYLEKLGYLLKNTDFAFWPVKKASNKKNFMETLNQLTHTFDKEKIKNMSGQTDELRKLIRKQKQKLKETS